MLFNCWGHDRSLDHHKPRPATGPVLDPPSHSDARRGAIYNAGLFLGRSRFFDGPANFSTSPNPPGAIDGKWRYRHKLKCRGPTCVRCEQSVSSFVWFAGLAAAWLNG